MFVAWNIRLFNYLIIIQTIIATLQKVAKIRYPKIRFCQCYDIFCVRLTKGLMSFATQEVGVGVFDF